MVQRHPDRCRKIDMFACIMIRTLLFFLGFPALLLRDRFRVAGNIESAIQPGVGQTASKVKIGRLRSLPFPGPVWPVRPASYQMERTN